MKRYKFLLLFLFLVSVSVGTWSKNVTGYIPVSGGARLYYEVMGKGTPVILLHGHSLDTRMWDEQYKVFARHHRVVRFDFRGYGRSSAATETFQFTHMRDLLTVMDSLHIQRAHIVGLSMGGFVAADFLGLHPERIITCTMASGVMKTYKGPSEPVDSADYAKREREIAAVKAKGVEQMKREWMATLMASGGSRRERMRKPLQRMIDDWSAWQSLHHEVKNIEAHDAERVFRSRKTLVPTLILYGATDKPRKPSWMLNYLPNGRQEVLPDCGHMMNMEQPELFNRTVLKFIDDNDIH